VNIVVIDGWTEVKVEVEVEVKEMEVEVEGRDNACCSEEWCFAAVACID